ncbi:MAG: HEAT repeat domain-containing protein [Thermoguttaceae bacterium]
MIGICGRSIVWWFLGGIFVLMAGCADLDILPAWVPFQGPVSDTMPGVVPPVERIAKIRKLSEEAGSAGAEQKQQVSRQLAESIREEKDPLIRMEIIRALGHYPGPEADTVLKAAIADPDVQVRMAACEAFGKRRDAESVKLLSETLRSDVDADVRLTAALALGETKNPEAVPALGEALNDSDPAMQYRAVLSLKQVTGKDLGNDVRPWQQYVKGETPDPAPSLAERLRHLFF